MAGYVEAEMNDTLRFQCNMPKFLEKIEKVEFTIAMLPSKKVLRREFRNPSKGRHSCFSNAPVIYIGLPADTPYSY